MDVTKEAIFDILKDSGAVADFDEIDSSTSLRASGFDSLDMATSLLTIEETYGVKIPDSDVEQLDSVDAIVAYLEPRVS